jgi:two-component system alkaline phosphatase synthesis response regulator PhoP
MTRILVVEDDAELLDGLQDNLESEGYEVVTAGDGEQAVLEAMRSRPDAIVLDVLLPKLSGFDVCRTLRLRRIHTPILMLTARSQESDKILGLELGADDYLTKPFGLKELLARLSAMIRRASRFSQDAERWQVGDLEIDVRRLEVRKHGRKIVLSSLEFEVLCHLIERRGQTVPRDHLLMEVWGYQAFRTTRAVDNLIGRLRQKLEDDPQDPTHILTVYGTGYKFAE